MRKLSIIAFVFLFVAACGDEDGSETPRPQFDAFIPVPNDMGRDDSGNDMGGDATVDMSVEDAEVDMYVGPTLTVGPDAVLRLNETLQLSATRIEGAESLDVTTEATWTVDDETVATVDGGLVTAVSEGVAEVTATHQELSTTVELRVFGNFVAIAAGSRHNCAATAGGSIACWGSSTTGAHGVDNVTRITEPTILDTELGFDGVTAGRDHSCAVTTAGDVWCWGDNSQGQLGDGSTISSSTPVQVQGISEIDEIMAGEAFTCALTFRDDLNGLERSVYCWGDNSRFQLGLGQGDFESTPQLISETDGTALALAVGDQHACALVETGALRLICWGDNEDAQLGDAMGARNSLAVDIAAPVDLVAAGGDMTCFRPQGESVRCIGTAVVSLGDTAGTMTSAEPVELALGQAQPTVISLGSSHSCVATLASSTRCWGDNGNGQLGLNSQASTPTPTEIFGTPDYLDVDVGEEHTCAIGMQGGAFCWGEGTDGQLGTGSSLSSLQPRSTALPVFR